MEKSNLIVLSDHYLTFVKDQVESLAGAFDHIHVLVRYNPVAEISNYLPVNRLKSFRKSALVDLEGKPGNITVHLIPVFFLPLDSEYKNLGKRYFNIIEKYLEMHKISGDLVHAHFLWPNGYAAIRLKEKFNIPVVVTAHGYDIYDLPFRDSAWREKIKDVLDRSDWIITVSRSNLDCIHTLGTTTPSWVIPNGFRGDLFFPMDKRSCREKLGLPLDRKIILSIGNLVEEKGQKFLIEAVANLVDHRDDIICILIGRGSLKRDLMARIRSLHLENHFLMAGGKPHNELPLWINACDIFVFPSLKESFGVVQIEAMACGKPVVATFNGGSEEIITPAVGVLIQPGSAGMLTDSIASAFAASWDEKTIHDYAMDYSWERLSVGIQQIYEKLIRSRGIHGK
nr:glycosyltransferase [uncultured Methanoregula sp.]